MFAATKDRRWIAQAIYGVILAGCAALAPTRADADLITVHFTGTVDSVDAPLAGTFSVGQTLTGSYTFESSTAARTGSDSTFAVFDALTALNFGVGGVYSASSTGAPEIQQDNNPGGIDHDRYGVVSRVSDGLMGPNVDGQVLDSFFFRMDDSTDSVFNDALVLATNLNINQFTSTAFGVFFIDNVSIGGHLTSIQFVPEPSSVVLVSGGIALLGLGGVRRRWRRRVS